MDLVSKSDVFIENNMPDTMKKLGLTYAKLKKHNPGIIMVRMPAFGLEGKYHRYRSWGQHVEGVAGHSWLKGYRDTDISQRPESNQSDAGAAYSAVMSVLMAMRHRRRTGGRAANRDPAVRELHTVPGCADHGLHDERSGEGVAG